ncbi:MAG: hypothetical protein AB7E72_01480 [Lysobacterales bacterium]
MRNIYCRNSRLSSLCLRILIERYVAGDTATEAQMFLTGTDRRPGHRLPPQDPSPQESALYVNRFLALYPCSYNQVQKFAESCACHRPDQWKPIRISRQTVNGYFLRLGRYCWKYITEPHLAERAREQVRVFDELNRELGLIDEELTKVLVQRMAARYVKQANGTLLAEHNVRLRYGRTIVYLTERARKLQGLSLHHCREHMAWAFMMNSVRAARGLDDHEYGARFLSSLLSKEPM